MIRLSHVTKIITDSRPPIVHDVTFSVEKGETLVILGSSGAGKSTVLKLINRLVKPSSGLIEINSRNINLYNPVQLRRTMGYVFQEIGLFPHLTIEENIAIVLRLIGQSKMERQQRAHELLELVGLKPSHYANRYPAELSGGQQQRVGVARALAADPEYLLMDEPFGALDAISRNDLQEEILRLKKELNKTIVFVTHDIFEALRLGDRIAVMHQGRLEQIGCKEELIHKSTSKFVQELMQKAAYQVNSYVEYFAC